MCVCVCVWNFYLLVGKVFLFKSKFTFSDTCYIVAMTFGSSVLTFWSLFCMKVAVTTLLP